MQHADAQGCLQMGIDRAAVRAGPSIGPARMPPGPESGILAPLKRRRGRASGRPLHRHVLDAADEVGEQPLRLARELHVREPGDELGQDELQLHPGQVRSEAEVRTAATERERAGSGTA